jgi:hypothetical protein
VGVYKFSAPGTLKTGRTLYTSMLAGNAKFVPFEPVGAYDSIATATIANTTTTTITFSSIPSTYTHLQLRYIIRTDRGDDYADAIGMRFNSDTGTNYYRHRFETENTGALVSGGNSGTDAQYHFMGATALCSSNVFASGVVDILDYTNTSKNKVTRSLQGVMDSATRNWMGVQGSIWVNTSAINRIDLKVNYGTNYIIGSTVALYGIKGA